MALGIFSFILTHGLSVHLLPSFPLYLSEQRPAGGRGPGLKNTEGEGKTEGEDKKIKGIGGKAKASCTRNIASHLQESVCVSEVALCVHFTVSV